MYNITLHQQQQQQHAQWSQPECTAGEEIRRGARYETMNGENRPLITYEPVELEETTSSSVLKESMERS